MRQPNYQRAIDCAHNLLFTVRIDSFPVPLKRILDSQCIDIVSYERYCNALDTTRKSLGSELLVTPDQLSDSNYTQDGFTTIVPAGYRIVFNNKASESRKRFTISHELGHIMLGHFNELSALSKLPAEELDELQHIHELEANCFARNLLCPAASAVELLREYGLAPEKRKSAESRIVWHQDADTFCMCPDLSDVYLFSASYIISHEFAQVRIDSLWRDFDMTPSSDRERLSNFSFTSCWMCSDCSAPWIDPSRRICYNCGTHNSAKLFLQKDIVDLKLPPRPVRIPYKGLCLTSCPFCGNEDIPDNSTYCIICGKALTNPCIPQLPLERTVRSAIAMIPHQQSHLNAPGINYCLICGSRTLYSLAYPESDLFEYLDDQEALDDTKPIPTVSYPPKITYDRKTFRAKICPVCRNSDLGQDTNVCSVCHTNLYNLCVGTENNYGDITGQHPNLPNARYCHICGRRTDAGKTLQSYKEIIAERKNHSS